MAKTILQLSADEALDFFLSHENYFSCELPEYFDFSKVLKFVKKTIGDKPYDDCLGDTAPECLNDANLEFLTNKDGRYAVRPFTLVNPYLYYFLVREICSNDNWSHTISCFRQFNVPHIEPQSIPVIPAKKEAFHNSTQILHWWNNIEQRSLELSLEYRYMFVTDITNCYGTINHQSIEWALTPMHSASHNERGKQLAHNIIRYLRAMQQGRNMGIPQGSAIFDFVAEIILGYADLMLHDKLCKQGITEGYEILRYRDDYRVYCNDRDMLEQISFILQEVLESLNFRMNSQKTKISQSLVTDSIKPDKLWYIENTPIFNKKGVDFDGIQKHLVFILLFGRKFSNAGQLKNLLDDLDKRIAEKLQNKEIIFENKRAICAIATQIAIDNVSVTHHALQIVSRITAAMSNEAERQDIIEKVRTKLLNRPNSLYDQLWLQNITYKQDVKNGICPYSLCLCRLVMGKSKKIWNNSWLKSELTKGLPVATICDKKKLKDAAPVITFRERRAYLDADDWERNIDEQMDRINRFDKQMENIEEKMGKINRLEEQMDRQTFCDDIIEMDIDESMLTPASEFDKIFAKAKALESDSRKNLGNDIQLKPLDFELKL